MAFFARLAVAFAGGLVVLAVLLVLAAYLLSDEPAVSRAPPPDRAELFATTLERRNAARSDFELVGAGVIVPTSAAAEVLNQCSRETVTPIEGYWRPTPTMVRELETRLPTFLSYESRLEPLTSYIRQYAGVVSVGRPLIYASFLTAPSDLPWQREVLIVCDGGNRAWGVAFDVQSKTFGEVRINGNFGRGPQGEVAR